MTDAGTTLFELLPAAIRNRDADAGNILAALLDIVGEQVDGVAAAIDRSYDDLFIETCADWVVPYLADLVGTTPLYDVSRCTDDLMALATFTDLRGPRLIPPGVASSRADVARTIAMRRRKGTVSALPDVARYASGYPIRLVEGLARIGWTQNRRHLRTDLHTATAGDRLTSSLVGTPFDQTTRFADVRRPQGAVGWYHHAHEMLAVYHLMALALRDVPARAGPAPWQFRLDPLGLDRPLFSSGAGAVALPSQLVAAGVPDQLTAALLEADLRSHVEAVIDPDTGDRLPQTNLYADLDADADAPAASLGIRVDGVFVTPAVDESAPIATYRPQLFAGWLDPWPATQPAGTDVVVDVRNGRVVTGDGWGPKPALTAALFHGTAGYLGGGSYERSGWLVAQPDEGVAHTVSATTVADYPDLVSAITDWSTTSTAPHTVLRVLDSQQYDVPAALDLAGRTLVIEAIDLQRPVLTPTGATTVSVTGPGSLTLSGIALDGGLDDLRHVDRLRILHCTLLPDGPRDVNGQPAAEQASIRVRRQALTLKVEIAFSILGTVDLRRPIDSVLFLDSIVVAAGTAPAVRATIAAISDVIAERTTFLGAVHCRALTASACLFGSRLVAERTQQGCLRYSYVVPDDPANPANDSRTPRRFACQPDLAVAAALKALPVTATAADRVVAADAERRRVRPVFVATDYGSPGLAELDPEGPAEIATGAEDGSEIGAYGHMKQAQRLDNLSRRVTEFLPAGIAAGYVLVR